MGKSSINGPFSMAMLNNQRVYTIKNHPNGTVRGISKLKVAALPNFEVGLPDHEKLSNNGWLYGNIIIYIYIYIFTNIDKQH